jgi:hypothetical protein
MGVMLDNADKPFLKPLSLSLYQKPEPLAVGSDGRFVLKQVGHGRQTLTLKQGDESLYMRRRLVEPTSEFNLDIDVQPGSGPLDLGKIYAESSSQGTARIAKTFGPYCERAQAGKPLLLPEEQMPLQLWRLYQDWEKNSDRWSGDFMFTAKELGGVAVSCRHVTEKIVGTYVGTGSAAYDYTWKLTVVLRDGRTLRKVLRAPPPKQAKAASSGLSGIQFAETGQEKQLESETKKWLAEALAGPP